MKEMSINSPRSKKKAKKITGLDASKDGKYVCAIPPVRLITSQCTPSNSYWWHQMIRRSECIRVAPSSCYVHIWAHSTKTSTFLVAGGREYSNTTQPSLCPLLAKQPFSFFIKQIMRLRDKRVRGCSCADMGNKEGRRQCKERSCETSILFQRYLLAFLSFFVPCRPTILNLFG